MLGDTTHAGLTLKPLGQALPRTDPARLQQCFGCQGSPLELSRVVQL